MRRFRLRKPRVRALVRRESLVIDDRRVEVALRLNRRARRLIVKVHPSTGEVTVVAPSRAGLAEALEFARKEKDWIARRLAKVPAQVIFASGARIPYRGVEHVIRHSATGKPPVRVDGEVKVIHVSGQPEHLSRRVHDFLKREARRVLDKRTQHFCALLGVAPRHIAVRDTVSRWGSCSSARVLSFSWRLILAPPFALDYVVAHEVAHLREMNHGKRFWTLVDGMVGDVSAAQAWLSTHGTFLHRYAAEE